MARKVKDQGGSLGSFLDEPTDLYSEKVEREIKRRILLTMAAYAYEFEHEIILSDDDFDMLSKKIDLSIDTRRPDLDAYFREHFEPDTGMWITKHPELDRVKEIYLLHYAPQKKKKQRTKK